MSPSNEGGRKGKSQQDETDSDNGRDQRTSSQKQIRTDPSQSEIETEQLRELMQEGSHGTVIAVHHPHPQTRASSSVEKQAIVDMVEQTKGIRHAIDTLRDDVLRLNGSRQDDATDDVSRLSREERAVLRLAAENLIQAIMATRDERKFTVARKQAMEKPTLHMESAF